MRPRLIGTAVLAVLAPLLILAATISTWVHFEIQSPDALGSHARQSLRQPEVRAALTDEITRRVAAADPRLFAATPVLRQATDILITSRQFADVIDIALQQVRRAIIEGRDVSGTRLSDLGDQLRQTLEVIDPSIAAQVPADWDTGVIDLSHDAPLPTALRYSENIGRFWWAWCVAAALSTAGWIAAASNRRRALAGFGAQLAAIGLALVLVRRAVGNGFADGVSASSRPALRAAYDVTTSGLYSLGVAFLAAGAVVLAATLTGSVVSVAASWVGRRLDMLRVPDRAHERVVWGLVAALLGGALALGSSQLGPAVAIVAGVILAFAGVNVLARSLPSRVQERRLTSRRRALAFCMVAVVLAAVVVVGRDRRDIADTEADVGQGTLICNGHAALCGKRLDQVTMAGTHNSMSSADAGFLFAEQTLNIPRQLEAGARVLMLDTHYGLPSSRGIVLTDLVFNDRAALVARYGEDTVRNIEQLRSTVATPSSPRSVYLCHSFCELGATPAVSAFSQIRTFLAKNPSEVLVIMIQDETEGADTVEALRLAGLDALAYTKPADEPWPTLGELVRSGTPLVVMSQREGGDPSWFMRMFTQVQDNPYTARSASELSCEPNRGPKSAPLFLLNNWITSSTPNMSNARRVNSKDFLVDRARTCAEERGQRVNFIAVDFWGAGGELAAVDELNNDAH